MTAFEYGSLVIGSQLLNSAYHYNRSGTLVQTLTTTHGPIQVTGLCFDLRGNLYTVLSGTVDGNNEDAIEKWGQDGTSRGIWSRHYDRGPGNIPPYPLLNDIDRLPDGSGFVVIGLIVETDFSFTGHLWHLDLDGEILNEWDVDLDTDYSNFGWYLHVAMGCDPNTVYYTDGMRTIFRFDLATGLQLPYQQQLAEDSCYSYSDLAVTSSGQILVAMTTEDGESNGPRNGVAIDVDRLWCDEINPSSRIFKRVLATGVQAGTTVSVSSTPISMATYYNQCPAGRSRISQATLIGAN